MVTVLTVLDFGPHVRRGRLGTRRLALARCMNLTGRHLDSGASPTDAGVYSVMTVLDRQTRSSDRLQKRRRFGLAEVCRCGAKAIPGTNLIIRCQL
jgi:hypothetical protein